MNLPNSYIQGVSMTGCLARLPSKALAYTLSFFLAQGAAAQPVKALGA